MRISDWSSDVCSSDLTCPPLRRAGRRLLPDTARSSYSRALALARCAAHSGCVAPCLRPGDLMSHLNTQSRFTSPDDFYERLIDAHRDLSLEQSHAMNAAQIGRASCRERVCQ